MAVIKVFSSKGNLKNIINYVTNPEKTDNTLISGKDCVAESAFDEMMSVKNMYDKLSGNIYFHFIQSFSPDDELSYKKSHEIGVKFAEYFKGYQVLIATHKDREHIHNHLIVNSVSFENGRKLHMSKNDLKILKEYSNQLCKDANLSIISLDKSKVKDVSKNELAVAKKGQSWKFKLMNDIDYCISISNTKEEYISNMNKLNYQVVWTETRKYITYITKEGYKCRDRSLHENKYLKETMENEFRGIKREKQGGTKTRDNSIDSEDGIYSSATRSNGRFLRMESHNKEQYFRNKKRYEEFTGKNIQGQFENKRRIERSYNEKYRKQNLLFEDRFRGNRTKRELQNLKNQMENRKYSFLYGINSFSNFFSNTQIDYIPKRRIRFYRTLSKQALKEYSIKKANSSGIEWFED